MPRPTAAFAALLAAAPLLAAGCGGDSTVVATDTGAGRAAAPSTPAPARPRAAGSSRDVEPAAPAPARPVVVRGGFRDAPVGGDRAKAVDNGRAVFEGSLSPAEQRLAATLVLEGVRDVPGAEAFLAQELRGIAGQFYTEQTAGSRAQTEANRKAAEREAVAESESDFGGMRFGGMVWYQYQRADAEIGNSRVKPGPSDGQERVFYLFPVPDLGRVAAMSPAFSEVSTDPSGRVVRLRTNLPNPLPDEEPDKLTELYPADQQLHLVVKYDTAFGEGRAREAWIRQRAGAPAMTPGGDRLLSVAKHKWLSSDGELVLTVAPVEDPEAYRDRVDFADIGLFDANKRRLGLIAKVPGNVQELADADRKAKRGSAGTVEDDSEPAPGESRTVWAARVIRDSDDHWARKDALKHLARVLPDEVEDGERAIVGDALLFVMRAPEWTEEDELTDLLMTWRPDGYAELMADRIIDPDAHRHEKEGMLRKLAAIDDPAAKTAAARAAVVVGQDRWAGRAAVEVLHDLGPLAEPFVLPLLSDPNWETRRDAATLLSRIGGEASVDALLARSRAEENAELAKHMRSARTALKKRLVAEEELRKAAEGSSE